MAAFEAFGLAELLAEHQSRGKLWMEFLRVPALSMGLYVLPAGQPDPQEPHTEDEIYYVVSGRAEFVAGDENMEVKAGDVLFVERLLEHRFHHVVEDLTVMVFFAPAETPSE